MIRRNPNEDLRAAPMPHTTPPETPTPSWTAETVMLINKLTPDIKDKSSDPDWFLLRQRFEEMERQLTAATAQLEEARRDKERMDWISGHHCKIYSFDTGAKLNVWKDGAGREREYYVDTSSVRLAIDAAMQKDSSTSPESDHKRLVRELDVLLNGDKAAAQASLCDIVAQVRKYSEKLRAVLEDHP